MGFTVRLVAVGKFVSVYVPAATLPSESVVQALDSIVNQDTCAAQVNSRRHPIVSHCAQQDKQHAVRGWLTPARVAPRKHMHRRVIR